MADVTVIGRQVERDGIAGWLDGERPAALLIEGAAGIGKSTLWWHELDRASARGDLVVAWQASRAESEIGFAVLAGLFERPDLAEILGELPEPRRRAVEVALGRTAPDRRPPEPSLIGLAVADILRALAGRQPTVIGVDDIQWCDRASDEVLAYAVRRLRAEPIGLVLARRTESPPAGAPVLAQALAGEQTLRLEVGPLSAGALGRLIHERLGIAYPRPLLLRVYDACAGNPFLALEIGRSLRARAGELAPGEPFPVPAEVGPLVRDHLATLTGDARRCVVIVAMSAGPSLELVERVLGPGAATAVDEACEKGVLVADGARLRAQHPLIASTAYADTPPGERRALRRALAAAADDPVEGAVHLAATLQGPDAEAAASLAAAGRLALARGDPSVATELLERASLAAVDPGQRAVLLIEAADAAVAAGDPARAEANLRAVLDLELGDRTRVRALLALGEIAYVAHPNDALSLLVQALDYVAGDPVLEATMHSHIAGMADMDPVAAINSAERAAEILQRPGVDSEPDHLACALLDRAFHCLLRGEPAPPDDIERGLSLWSRSGDSFVARRAQEVAARSLFHLGRLAESLALDETEYRRLTERGQFGLVPPLLQTLSVMSQLTGDWTAARRYAEECVELVEQGEQVWGERAILTKGRILAWEGELDAARTMARPALERQEAAGDRWEGAIFAALLGFVELSVPDPPAALGYLTTALAHADAIAVVLPTQFRFLGDLVEAAALAGDLELASDVLATRLEEPAKRQQLPWSAAMAGRGAGLLAAARGELDEAIGHYDRALRVYDTALAMPFERARTVFARGQSHRRAGHRRAARADLSEARSVFEALGARAWLSRAGAELRRLGGRVPSGSELTAAERMVAVAGRSNREIAAELVVSIRTVESQLGAVYRKLGVHSRGQLGSALAAR